MDFSFIVCAMNLSLVILRYTCVLQYRSLSVRFVTIHIFDRLFLCIPPMFSLKKI